MQACFKAAANMDNTLPSSAKVSKTVSKEYPFIRKNVKLNNLVAILQQQNNSLLNENLKLSGTVSQLKAFIQELKEQMLNLTENGRISHVECKNEQKSLIATIKQLKKVIADLDQEKAQLECNLSKIFKSDSDENSLVFDYEEKYYDLKKEYEESLKKWESEKIEYQDKIDQLTSDLAQLTMINQELDHKYITSQGIIQQLNSSILESKHNIAIDPCNTSINITLHTEESSLFDLSYSNTSLNQSCFESLNNLKKQDRPDVSPSTRSRIRNKLDRSSRKTYKLPNNLADIMKKAS
jgi:predicted  nucleic acid-binding Zn-ribbon protein